MNKIRKKIYNINHFTCTYTKLFSFLKSHVSLFNRLLSFYVRYVLDWNNTD